MKLRGPQADPDLKIIERDDYFLARSRTGAMLRLNELQVEVLRRSDGHSTIDDIADACSEQFEQEIPTEAVEGFLNNARKLGMLSVRYAGPVDGPLAAKRCRCIVRRLHSRGLPPRSSDSAIVSLRTRVIERLQNQDFQGALDAAYDLEAATNASSWALSVVREVERLGDPLMGGVKTPLFLTLPLVNPARWLEWMDRRLGWIFSWRGFLAWLVFVLGGLWLALKLSLVAGSWRPNATAVAALYITWAGSILIHEFSHALTCVHFGGPVKRMGLGLMWGIIPFAFADVTASYLFGNKKQRLLVILAGTMGTLFSIASAIYLCGLLPPEHPVRTGLMWFIVTGGTTNLIFNLSPFIKLDGYYLLSEMLDMPNLWSRSFDFAGQYVGRFVVGEAVPIPQATPRERWILLGYASLALAYTAAIVIYSLVKIFEYVAPLWRGYGLMLFGAGLVIFFGPSTVRLCRQGSRLLRRHRAALLSVRGLTRITVPLAAVAPVLTSGHLKESASAHFVVPSEQVELSPLVAEEVSDIVIKTDDDPTDLGPAVSSFGRFPNA